MKHTVVEYWDHLVQSPFIIGFAGALTSMMAGRKVPLGRKLAMGAAGTMSAGFISPAVCVWLGIETPEYRSAMAFAIGMIGLQVTGGIIRLGEDIKNNPGKYIPKSWKT